MAGGEDMIPSGTSANSAIIQCANCGNPITIEDTRKLPHFEQLKKFIVCQKCKNVKVLPTLH